jgi:DNA polymerase-3 subunit beta
MKVSFLSDKLQEKLTFLNHGISIRGQLPILSCFLLEAREGKLTIKATDLEIGISSSIEAVVEKEGSVAVLAKNFTDLLANLGSKKITLTQEGETLVLSGEKVKASFQTMPQEEFPKLYDDKGEEYITLKKEEVEKYFLRVAFAASTTETTRPALSGVLIDEEKGSALLVATDSYRLSLQKNVFKTAQELRKPLVVPSRVIKELFLIKEQGVIKINVSDKNNQVLFFQGSTVLVGRLIEAEYPEYQKIIPSEFNTKTEVNREELLKAIRIASVFARETANIIKFSIEKTKITVSANSPSVGQDSVDLEAKTTGESNEIAFNAKYLLDILSTLEEESVIFEMNGPLNPGVFKLKEDNSFLHLIMPIRVQG